MALRRAAIPALLVLLLALPLAGWIVGMARAVADPTNDSVTLDLTSASYKGTKTLLPAKQDYNFTLKVSDTDGVADLNYAEIRLDPTGKNVQLRWTEATGVFSEQSDPSNYVVLNTGTSSAYTTGTQKVIKFYVAINWAWGDSSETMTVQAYVIDDAAASDTDNYTNIFGVEAHLASATLAVNDYRVNLSQTLIMSGYWYYNGTVIAPPDGNYAVMVKLAGVQKGSTDTTLVSGAFSINDVTAAAAVGSYSYVVYASYNASVGSFSAVAVDAVMVSLSIEDNRMNVGDLVYANVNATYAYDGAAITDGTILMNGTAMAHMSGSWWRLNMSQPVIGQWTYCVNSVTGNTYGITTLGIINLNKLLDRFTILDSPDFVFNAFTLAVWTKPTASSAVGYLISQYDGPTGDGYFLYQTDDRGDGLPAWIFEVLVNHVGNFIYSDSAPVAGAWQHIVGMRDLDGNLKMYVDGVLQTNTTVVGGGVIDSTASVYIGTLTTIPAADYNGYLCEHRFYNRALLLPEIYQLYQGRFVNSTGLIARYGRSSYDYEAALWRDFSGNGHDGVIQGVTVTLGLSTDETVRPIWDQLAVSWAQDLASPATGQSVQVTVSLTRQYDSSVVTTYLYSVSRNGTAYNNPHSTATFTDLRTTAGTWVYDFTAITDTLFGLTLFVDPANIAVTWHTPSPYTPGTTTTPTTTPVLSAKVLLPSPITTKSMLSLSPSAIVYMSITIVNPNPLPCTVVADYTVTNLASGNTVYEGSFNVTALSGSTTYPIQVTVPDAGQVDTWSAWEGATIIWGIIIAVTILAAALIIHRSQQ